MESFEKKISAQFKLIYELQHCFSHLFSFTPSITISLSLSLSLSLYLSISLSLSLFLSISLYFSLSLSLSLAINVDQRTTDYNKVHDDCMTIVNDINQMHIALCTNSPTSITTSAAIPTSSDQNFS